jgi:RNA polymerase sigma factor (sigma-70 family)
MLPHNSGISVLNDLLSRVAAYVSRRIPNVMRSRLDVNDVLQEIARTILRSSLKSSRELSSSDWERMIWVIVQRQLRKQLKRVASPEDSNCMQFDEVDPLLSSPQKSDNLLSCDALDELSVVLSHCSERERRIVQYRLEGMSITEVAAKEGVHEGSIRRLLSNIEDLYMSQIHG